MSPLGPPRRIVTSNLSLPEALATTSNPQPEVTIEEHDIVPLSVLGGNAAIWPIHTYHRVPTDANEPYSAPLSSSASDEPSAPHEGANAQFNDLAPGAKVPLHRTTQCDFMVLISGELILGVPSEPYDPASTKEPKLREIFMKPGDVVMQRGTLHSWENPSQTEWSRLLGVGLRSNPIEVDVVSNGTAQTTGRRIVLHDTFDP
ncbi:hypothetical protein BX600DRAFT_303207 [Xylariales sp. PMI_506]|nr:hypothetical protein BX600DRAFT_303207 [Xylariales sp. PMI_506]